MRDQLAPFSDLAPFEHDVEASIRRSARTGSLDDLAHTLRTWLGIALQARWAAEGHLVRGSEREAAVDAWITAHPEYLHRRAATAGNTRIRNTPPPKDYRPKPQPHWTR